MINLTVSSDRLELHHLSITNTPCLREKDVITCQTFNND